MMVVGHEDSQEVSHGVGGLSLCCLWHILLLPHLSPKQKSLDLRCQQKEGFMRFGLNVLVLAFHVLPYHKNNPTKKQ